jgi:transposase InsO family protein
MLQKEIFASLATEPEIEIQKRIEKLLDHDESLEEILNFLQTGSSAPAYVKKGFKDYSMEAGLLFYQGQIVVPDNEELKQDLMATFHDSPISGPPGQQRTLELISRRCYWPGMRAKIFHYVKTCETCQRIKRAKPTPIPVQPLEIPTRPWQHISYDMIVGLPSDGGKDAILVIVNSFSKYGIMVPCSSKVTAKDIADLFLDHVWKRHGFPEKTVSDRGPVFNNKYIKALYERLGIKAHFSSAYHPQSDGQTERMNPGIEQFLRAYAGMYQKDWVTWLPMAEFSYNNAVHSATGTSPFRCLYGRDPVMTLSKVVTEVPEVNNMANTLQEIWEETSTALRLAKERVAGREPGEVPEKFEIGEKVWLDS